jgi:predicted molibdopterin-dependent oxidoreductase YjgC
VNLGDARRAGIQDGDFVEVTSRRGKAVAQCRVSAAIREGTCFLPFHWGREAGFYKSANNLTLSGRDPLSHQPELKACAVRLRRVTPATLVSGAALVNKIEALKAERDGLDVSEDLVRFAREGGERSPTMTRSG